MNTTTLKGEWNTIKEMLKQKYARLIDEDLTYVEGREDELFNRIHYRTGVSVEEVKQYLRHVFNCEC